MVKAAINEVAKKTGKDKTYIKELVKKRNRGDYKKKYLQITNNKFSRNR